MTTRPPKKKASPHRCATIATVFAIVMVFVALNGCASDQLANPPKDALDPDIDLSSKYSHYDDITLIYFDRNDLSPEAAQQSGSENATFIRVKDKTNDVLYVSLKEAVITDEHGEPLPLGSIQPGDVFNASIDVSGAEPYPQHAIGRSLSLEKSGGKEELAPYQSTIDNYLSIGRRSETTQELDQ